MTNPNPSEKQYTFVQKTWIVGGIFALIAVLLLLFQATFNVLVLILAGALISVFFHGVADLLRKKTPLGKVWSLIVAVLIVLLLAAGFFWLIGAKVNEQVDQLTEMMPQFKMQLKEFLSNTRVGQLLQEQMQKGGSQEKVAAFFANFFRSTFGIIGEIYVILFIGLFFTVAPHLYTKGMVRLVPPSRRDRANDLLSNLGRGLKRWLAGKLFAMAAVAVMTAIALLIIGMPMWLALAVIAGLLNFIPNFGPVIAGIPAALVALSISPTTALIVIIVYVIIQVIESNFITPKVQQHLIKIPPALIIIAQVLVGTIAGFWGLLLATPLALIVMIVVGKLYVEPMEVKA